MRSSISEIRCVAVDVRASLLHASVPGDLAAEMLRLNAALESMRELKSRAEVIMPDADECAELRSELRGLHADLAQLGKLVDHGETFWRGLGQVLGLDSSGYTQSGMPATMGSARVTSTKVVA